MDRPWAALTIMRMAEASLGVWAEPAGILTGIKNIPTYSRKLRERYQYLVGYNAGVRCGICRGHRIGRGDSTPALRARCQTHRLAAPSGWEHFGMVEG